MLCYTVPYRFRYLQSDTAVSGSLALRLILVFITKQSPTGAALLQQQSTLSASLDAAAITLTNQVPFCLCYKDQDAALMQDP